MDEHIKNGQLKTLYFAKLGITKPPNLGFETSQTWDLKLAIFGIGMKKRLFYGKIEELIFG